MKVVVPHPSILEGCGNRVFAFLQAVLLIPDRWDC